MKHIKLFEGFSTEDYYKPLEGDDYFEKVRMSVENHCFFSRKDIKYLMSLFYSTYPLYKMVVIEPRLGKGGQMYDHQLLVSKEEGDDERPSLPKTTDTSLIRRRHASYSCDADFKGEMLDSVVTIVSYTTPSSIGFSISPVEDDYFVVNIDMFSKTARNNNNRYYLCDQNNRYYLCDQMGGLMKLFKDKGIL